MISDTQQEELDNYIGERKRQQAEKEAREMIEAQQQNAQYDLGLTGMLSGRQYNQSPREYLHQFLLSAMHAGCNVGDYVKAEIERMLIELKR